MIRRQADDVNGGANLRGSAQQTADGLSPQHREQERSSGGQEKPKTPVRTQPGMSLKCKGHD